ncbi:MAG: hypothetical protein K9I68_10785, partial [Bacteroidales bacterium]|nr:hypothetical protein [Bacteroidales bacterium]MCF8337331.1 hypothetical protein [Bacteroidales bacterium]
MRFLPPILRYRSVSPVEMTRFVGETGKKGERTPFLIFDASARPFSPNPCKNPIIPNKSRSGSGVMQ